MKQVMSLCEHHQYEMKEDCNQGVQLAREVVASVDHYH